MKDSESINRVLALSSEIRILTDEELEAVAEGASLGWNPGGQNIFLTAVHEA